MHSVNLSFNILDVIENDYCIGCGACVAVDNTALKISMNENGQYHASIENDLLNIELVTSLNSVCPFANGSENEDEISQREFSDLSEYNKKIGFYDRLFAGHVAEGEYRKTGSSGGFGSWLCGELLKQNLVDEIIHIKPDHEDKFVFGISKTVEEVNFGAKSRYYPVEMSSALEYIKNSDKRFAIVGVPCFIKATHLLSNSNKKFDSKILFRIGLVCGHLKSKFYADMLALKMGHDIQKSYDINFREKIEGKTANRYGTKITSKTASGTKATMKMTNEIFGTKWSYGFFKYNACDYCDDVLGETADITIGDAWLPEYVDNYLGSNIIVSRNKKLSSIIDAAKTEKRVVVDILDEERIIESQAGGFRHRHDGLSYRLHLKDKKNLKRPTKRIQASSQHLNISRKMVFKLRMKIRKRSFRHFQEAVLKKDITYFDNKMKKWVFLHDLASKISLTKVVNKLKGVIARII